jgi:hypothetical protein
VFLLKVFENYILLPIVPDGNTAMNDLSILPMALGQTLTEPRAQIHRMFRLARSLVNKRAGEKIMVDIFTLLLGIVSICVLAGAVTKIMLRPPKVWDEEDWMSVEIEEGNDYKELRKNNPHIWMD